MGNYAKPRGTRDFLPLDAGKLQILEMILKEVVSKAGYKQIITPIFEHTEVFTRSAGESSDIVNKEMYTFLDKGNRSISLRPEGTAGVIRAFVENKMHTDPDLPIKLFYFGPNFRYEKPQAGRFRQFYQFGVECIGLRNPYLDAENIILATEMLKQLGIHDIEIKVNSIGDNESRERYKEALREYFRPYLDTLCEDCKVRFEKNPLRILDCKVDGNKECMKNYPRISDYLSLESQEYFAKVCKVLGMYNLPYTIDPKLVRGLDYYNDVVFEVYAKAENGTSYGAVLAGGRYDSMVDQFGGPKLPSVGFAAGADRLLLVMEDLGLFKNFTYNLTTYVMPLDKEAFEYAFDIMLYLRSMGVDSEIDYNMRKIGSQFKTVDRKKATFALIIGTEEMNNGQVQIKINETKEQYKVNANEIIPFMQEYFMKKQQEEHAHHHGCGCGHHHDDEHECCCGGHGHDEDHECHCHEDVHECCCGEHDGEHECHCHEEGHECCCGEQGGEHECHCHEEDHECKCGHHHDK